MKLIVTSICTLLLAGCTSYTIDGKRYNNLSEATDNANSLDDFASLEKQMRVQFDTGKNNFEDIRRKWFVQYYYPQVRPAVEKAILQGKIRLEMTREEVQASWGLPQDTSKSVSSLGIIETWEYGYYSHRVPTPYYILTFKDSVLVDWTRL